jgi:hypothetical protein
MAILRTFAMALSLAYFNHTNQDLIGYIISNGSWLGIKTCLWSKFLGFPFGINLQADGRQRQVFIG